MASENYFSGVTKVVTVSSSTSRSCTECNDQFALVDDIEEEVNHYINEHDYKLLHVGTETGRSTEGDVWHSTVATLGK